MNFWSLLASFAPWIFYRFIEKLPYLTPIMMTDVAICVALLISLYLVLRSGQRGIIAYTGVLFFALALVAVVLMKNALMSDYLGLLSQLFLTGATWLSVATRRPFTISYARKVVAEEYWEHPIFIKRNMQISSIWGAAFTISLIASALELYFLQLYAFFAICDYGSTVAAICLTIKMSKSKKD